eukprot:COSAG04_NODE_1703_length_5883_cov_393.943811_4_plen_165_part_00
MSAKDGARLMKEIDADGDGSISKAEFEIWWLEHGGKKFRPSAPPAPGDMSKKKMFEKKRVQLDKKQSTAQAEPAATQGEVPGDIEAPTQADEQGWGIRMISGVSAPRFRPFFAHFPPSLARSLRLGARKPGSAKKRRKNGGKRAKNGVETGVSDPYIRMPQPCR